MDDSTPIRPSEPQPLDVLPLNSINPVASTHPHYQESANIVEIPKPKPALVYLPSQPSKDEWNNILSATNNGVALTGSAAEGTMGPLLGKIDIGESTNSYLFRVSLPGVAREGFTCDVAPDGQILIKGVTTTGEKTVYKHSFKFEMQSQNLCPPGVFSISFKLPGPVDSQDLIAHFGVDAVFEGVVKKKMISD